MGVASQPLELVVSNPFLVESLVGGGAVFVFRERVPLPMSVASKWNNSLCSVGPRRQVLGLDTSEMGLDFLLCNEYIFHK